MSEKLEFQPLTSPLGIAGSSYQLQMGKVNNYWAIRLVKGSTVLSMKVYKENSDEIPLGNHLTGWVLSVISLPNINPYQIQKTITAIRQKAMKLVEDQKNARETAGKDEFKSVILKKVPEKVQIRRLQVSGKVVNKGTDLQNILKRVERLVNDLENDNLELKKEELKKELKSLRKMLLFSYRGRTLSCSEKWVA
jgi:hypothetical protein